MAQSFQSLFKNPEKQIIKQALREDLGRGDCTTDLLIKKNQTGVAYIIAKESGFLCGGLLVSEVFKCLDSKVKVRSLVAEGRPVKRNEKVIRITGPIHSILKGERVALNFLAHLSGIATKTAMFKKSIRGYSLKLLDTRKTTPLLRMFEKYAVRCGGGENHRQGLFDAVLVKENHRTFGDLKKLKHLKSSFEIEVRNFKELREALLLKPKIILLDNFTPRRLKKAVSFVRKSNRRVLLEASGGINLKNISSYAKTGVNRISVGALTHSIKSVDFSLLIQ